MEHSEEEMAFPVSDTNPDPGNFKTTGDLKESEEKQAKTKLPEGYMGLVNADDFQSTDTAPKSVQLIP